MVTAVKACPTRQALGAAPNIPQLV